MSEKIKILSETSRAVLAMISAGHTYTQIVESYPGMTYPEVFSAAKAALALDAAVRKTLGTRSPEEPERAYEPWTRQEEQTLLRMRKEGFTNPQIANHLKRKPSAIESRLRRLDGQ